VTAPSRESPTTSSAYDCETGRKKDREKWSMQKKKWCCSREGVECPATTTIELRDCQATPRRTWSQDKREWCCKHKQLGCPEAGVEVLKKFAKRLHPAKPLLGVVTRSKSAVFGVAACIMLSAGFVVARRCSQTDAAVHDSDRNYGGLPELTAFIE